MKKIICVEVLRNHTLICTLSDKCSYQYDMSFVKTEQTPMTRPLVDPVFFAKVFLENGHLTWPNGYDIHADTIALDGLPIEGNIAKA